GKLAEAHSRWIPSCYDPGDREPVFRHLMRHPPDVSIVIPCYCSEQSLPDLIERIHQTMSAAKVSCEVVMVEDGSPDGTWKVIGELALRYPFIRGLRLMRNYGQHNALLCGIRAAHGET